MSFIVFVRSSALSLLPSSLHSFIPSFLRSFLPSYIPCFFFRAVHLSKTFESPLTMNIPQYRVRLDNRPLRPVREAAVRSRLRVGVGSVGQGFRLIKQALKKEMEHDEN